MNKKYISTILLSCLFLTAIVGTAVSAEDRPDWAIDPKEDYDRLDDSALHDEYISSDYTSYTDLTDNVDAWFQVWVSPADCNDSTPDCNAVIGIAYINISEEIGQDTIDNLRTLFDGMGEVNDITDDVPYASLAVIVESVTDFSTSVAGFCVYESGKHITSYVITSTNASSSASSATSGEISLAAEDEATAMENLMIASGEAAQSALGMIPGYDVFITLGLASVVTAILIYKKKKKV
ncbi:MAG: hypothetical protein R6U96_10275 [Promethearchaeia archaeon]